MRMLTVMVLVQNLRWLVPMVFMLGAAPGYITIWATWRVLSLVLPRRVYTKGDDFLFSSYHRHILFCFEKLAGIEVILYGDQECASQIIRGENCLYISNHQSSADWVIASCVAIRHGCLGRLRYVLKDGLKFLPFYGFYLRMHGSVFINKTGKFNKQRAEKQLSKYAKDKKPMWLVIFPEGTRFNPRLKRQVLAHKKFTESKGLEHLKFVLYPRIQAVQVSLEQLGDNFDSLYNITMAYSNTYDFKEDRRKPAPTMLDFLMGKSPKVHVHIQRIPITNVPVETDALKHWLYERCYEKEWMLSYFYSAPNENEAKFPGEQIKRPLYCSSLVPSTIFWGGSVLVANCFKETRELYWKTGIIMASAGLIYMAVCH